MQYKEFKGSYADLSKSLRSLQTILQQVQQVQMNVTYVRTCIDVVNNKDDYASLEAMQLEHIATEKFLDDRAFRDSIADAYYLLNVEVTPVDHNRHLLKPSTSNTAFLDIWDNTYPDYEGDVSIDFDMTAPFTSIIRVMDAHIELKHQPYLFDTYSDILSESMGLKTPLLYEDIHKPLSEWNK